MNLLETERVYDVEGSNPLASKHWSDAVRKGYKHSYVKFISE